MLFALVIFLNPSVGFVSWVFFSTPSLCFPRTSLRLYGVIHFRRYRSETGLLCRHMREIISHLALLSLLDKLTLSICRRDSA